jgi:hypothetical protein
MKSSTITTVLILGMFNTATASDLIPVTPENYVQVETERNIQNWSNENLWTDNYQLGILGKKAPTVRMNRDTLYRGAGVVPSDPKKGITVTLPKYDDSTYMSLTIIGNDGFTPVYTTKSGSYTVKGRDAYWILIRTGVKNKNSKPEIEAAKALSNSATITGHVKGKYTMPNYDMNQWKTLTAKYNADYGKSGEKLEYFQSHEDMMERFPNERDGRLRHAWSHAAGFGGMKPELGISNAYSVSNNMEGDVCRTMTFEDPKNRFFTSITVYDVDGYMMEGENHINSYGWKINKNNTITISFNCGKDAINNLVSNGKKFNFAFRHYGVSKAVMEGTWKAPNAKDTVVRK